MSDWSPAVLAYLREHAIETDVLAEVGVTEDGDSLAYPNGRRRNLNGGPKVTQPAGAPLAAWWPTGRPNAGAKVIVAEGESDALAVIKPLHETLEMLGIRDVSVIAVPGTGYPIERLVTELAQAHQGFLCFDADGAGRRSPNIATASSARSVPSSIRLKPKLAAPRTGSRGSDATSRTASSTRRTGRTSASNWPRSATARRPRPTASAPRRPRSRRGAGWRTQRPRRSVRSRRSDRPSRATSLTPRARTRSAWRSPASSKASSSTVPCQGARTWPCPSGRPAARCTRRRSPAPDQRGWRRSPAQAPPPPGRSRECALAHAGQGHARCGPPGSPALPNTGSLVNVDQNCTFTVVAAGLDRPTSLEFIGNIAYAVTLGGEIWKLERFRVRPAACRVERIGDERRNPPGVIERGARGSSRASRGSGRRPRLPPLVGLSE